MAGSKLLRFRFVQWPAVHNSYVAERMRVETLIVLPDGPDMNGSAADAMAGGDYDGDEVAFCLLKGRVCCPSPRFALYNTAYDGEYTCGARDDLCKRHY